MTSISITITITVAIYVNTEFCDYCYYYHYDHNKLHNTTMLPTITHQQNFSKLYETIAHYTGLYFSCFSLSLSLWLALRL